MLKITFLSHFNGLQTACEKFALKHNGYTVPDYEKEYRKMIDRTLTDFDFFRIAKGILNKETEYEQSSKQFLLCINNPFLVYRKSLQTLQEVHPRFADIFKNTSYNIYFSQPENPLIKEFNLNNQNVILTPDITTNFLEQNLL